MGTGFSKRKKQAKMMQEQMMKMQEEMKNLEATGTAGNGLVTITINGDHEITAIKIKPECVDADDIEGLEDLIKAAYKHALDQIKEHSPMGQMELPPGLPSGLGNLFG